MGLNKKLIAENSIYLYLRLFVTIVINLYITRKVLSLLGETDYGIYNVVGGVVNMLAFLNVGMITATQRYISYELGKNNLERLKKVFNTAINIHILIAFLIIIIVESIGFWVLNNKLDIPTDRLISANWVLHFSVLSFALTIITVPYNSCIVAHECMKVYAYISMLEVGLNLIMVLCLHWVPLDHLIIYALCLCFIKLIIRVIYQLYCRCSFQECRRKFEIDWKLFREMFAFAGWGMVGNLGFTFKDQISNILLNIFFGPVVNAARGIANQVGAAMNQLGANISMAINPQITKQYAVGNIYESSSLVYMGARISFYMQMIIVIPFLINSNTILKLWLNDVPEYCNLFVWIILIGSLIYTMSHSVSTAIIATGKIKIFQTLLAFILLSEIPLSYIILINGGTPYEALYPSWLVIFLSLLLRIFLLKKYVPTYSIKHYLVYVVFRCMFVFIFCLGIAFYTKMILFSSSSVFNMIYSIILSILYSLLTILYIGINKEERLYLKRILYAKLCKRR